jgi:predicted transcriptional regulator
VPSRTHPSTRRRIHGLLILHINKKNRALGCVRTLCIAAQFLITGEAIHEITNDKAAMEQASHNLLAIRLDQYADAAHCKHMLAKTAAQKQYPSGLRNSIYHE